MQNPAINVVRTWIEFNEDVFPGCEIGYNVSIFNTLISSLNKDHFVKKSGSVSILGTMASFCEATNGEGYCTMSYPMLRGLLAEIEAYTGPNSISYEIIADLMSTNGLWEDGGRIG